MGRKTWESIPPKFRPLKDRTNIVISRSYPAFSIQDSGPKEYHQAPSLESAIQGLSSASSSEQNANTEDSSTSSNQTPAIEKTFIIGGGQIYAAALELKETKRILLTRVLDEFDCDTYFPAKLGEDGGWVKREKGELDSWVGEVVPEDVQVEGVGGTRYVFEMWERVV